MRAYGCVFFFFCLSFEIVFFFVLFWWWRVVSHRSSNDARNRSVGVEVCFKRHGLLVGFAFARKLAFGLM